MAKVTAKDRKKSGMRGGSKGGKYPVATKAQARSAIKLRHHGKGVSASAVLAHVARKARSKGWADILAAVKNARARDRKKN
jgi:hypothetical protein